jgi:hypothetical protein
MVVLALDAPCRPRERVEIRHRGLVFAATTDGMGQLSVEVPALDPDAAFEASLAGGAQARAAVAVPEAARVERVVLQWAGPVALKLHALEFGAPEGAAGHVRPGAGQSPARALRSGGGFLSVLGDPALDAPLLAQVYSLPLTPQTRAGIVRLVLEADASRAGCNQPVRATTWRIGPGLPAATLDIGFTMPPCGEDGQILLLKNAVQDLKIARN